METKLLHKLRSTIEFMSSAERKIATLILAAPEGFTKLSLGEVSRLSGASQGSIVNFSKKYSGGGFPELKMAIAKAILSEVEPPFSLVDSNDSMKSVLKKTAEGISLGLRNTVALNDGEAMEKAARLILNAKKIEIYGIFRSAVVATDMYYQFIQLGLPANFISDVLTCAMSASLLNSESLVIAVSISGQTQDVIDAVKLAKEKGAMILALTARTDSPIASLADVTLIAAPSGNALSSHSSEVRASQLFIVDALCDYLRESLGGGDNERYTKMSEILRSHNVKDN